ncbi:hypothetical protein GL263_13110 [Streptomyces durbertensis]|uniref:Uncharacterized protein n=1 Tax=Streptomyces durbertensis TaxID=2448886 RepID=A0ABR6EGN1_9ACTN|nr:hypothetical protein [Streptomyces durbertensis]
MLRRHVPGAWWWVPANVAAWGAGLAAFALVSTPLWREGQGPVLVALIGAGAGLVMAATVAAVTGWALVRLLRHARVAAPEAVRVPVRAGWPAPARPGPHGGATPGG